MMKKWKKSREENQKIEKINLFDRQINLISYHIHGSRNMETRKKIHSFYKLINCDFNYIEWKESNIKSVDCCFLISYFITHTFRGVSEWVRRKMSTSSHSFLTYSLNIINFLITNQVSFFLVNEIIKQNILIYSDIFIISNLYTNTNRR